MKFCIYGHFFDDNLDKCPYCPNENIIEYNLLLKKGDEEALNLLNDIPEIGNYKLIEYIGCGGFGYVYKAIHKTLSSNQCVNYHNQ